MTGDKTPVRPKKRTIGDFSSAKKAGGGGDEKAGVGASDSSKPKASAASAAVASDKVSSALKTSTTKRPEEEQEAKPSEQQRPKSTLAGKKGKMKLEHEAELDEEAAVAEEREAAKKKPERKGGKRSMADLQKKDEEAGKGRDGAQNKHQDVKKKEARQTVLDGGGGRTEGDAGEAAPKDRQREPQVTTRDSSAARLNRPPPLETHFDYVEETPEVKKKSPAVSAAAPPSPVPKKGAGKKKETSEEKAPAAGGKKTVGKGKAGGGGVSQVGAADADDVAIGEDDRAVKKNAGAASAAGACELQQGGESASDAEAAGRQKLIADPRVGNDPNIPAAAQEAAANNNSSKKKPSSLQAKLAEGKKLFQTNKDKSSSPGTKSKKPDLTANQAGADVVDGTNNVDNEAVKDESSNKSRKMSPLRAKLGKGKKEEDAKGKKKEDKTGTATGLKAKLEQGKKIIKETQKHIQDQASKPRSSSVQARNKAQPEKVATPGQTGGVGGDENIPNSAENDMEQTVALAAAQISPAAEEDFGVSAPPPPPVDSNIVKAADKEEEEGDEVANKKGTGKLSLQDKLAQGKRLIKDTQKQIQDQARTRTEVLQQQQQEELERKRRQAEEKEKLEKEGKGEAGHPPAIEDNNGNADTDSSLRLRSGPKPKRSLQDKLAAQGKKLIQDSQKAVLAKKGGATAAAAAGKETKSKGEGKVSSPSSSQPPPPLIVHTPAEVEEKKQGRAPRETVNLEESFDRLYTGDKTATRPELLQQQQQQQQTPNVPKKARSSSAKPPKSPSTSAKAAATLGGRSRSASKESLGPKSKKSGRASSSPSLELQQATNATVDKPQRKGKDKKKKDLPVAKMPGERNPTPRPSEAAANNKQPEKSDFLDEELVVKPPSRKSSLDRKPKAVPAPSKSPAAEQERKDSNGSSKIKDVFSAISDTSLVAGRKKARSRSKEAAAAAASLKPEGEEEDVYATVARGRRSPRLPSPSPVPPPSPPPVVMSTFGQQQQQQQQQQPAAKKPRSRRTSSERRLTGTVDADTLAKAKQTAAAKKGPRGEAEMDAEGAPWGTMDSGISLRESSSGTIRYMLRNFFFYHGTPSINNTMEEMVSFPAIVQRFSCRPI